MPNAWVEHIRVFAQRNNMSYGCALSNPECLRSYKKKKEPKKPGPTFTLAELEDLKWEFTYVEGLQRLPNTVSLTYPRSNKKVFVGDKVVIKVESMDAKIYSSISNSLVCAGKWDKNLLVITTKKSGTCTVTVTGSQTNFLKAFKEKYVISVQGKR